MFARFLRLLADLEEGPAVIPTDESALSVSLGAAFVAAASTKTVVACRSKPSAARTNRIASVTAAVVPPMVFLRVETRVPAVEWATMQQARCDSVATASAFFDVAGVGEADDDPPAQAITKTTRQNEVSACKA